MFIVACSCSKRHLIAYGCIRLHIAAHGCIRLYMVAYGCIWLLTGVYCCIRIWLYMAAYGGIWLHTTPMSLYAGSWACIRLHMAASGCVTMHEVASGCIRWHKDRRCGGTCCYPLWPMVDIWPMEDSKCGSSESPGLCFRYISGSMYFKLEGCTGVARKSQGRMEACI